MDPDVPGRGELFAADLAMIPFLVGIGGFGRSGFPGRPDGRDRTRISGSGG